ncbi:MAG TPA: VWA domain-containing protein [Bacteroidota bacterium]|nr:VWA domain-containing protein [Bacteroidota bacterium]
MLKFANPALLWWLLLIPVGAVFHIFVQRIQQRKLSALVNQQLWHALIPDLSIAKRAIKSSLFLAALALVILAAARPQVGTRLEEIKREGIDMFVALDVSMSMKAEDIRPNRLEKAKRDVSTLLKKLQGDRVGLIVFAGEAFVQFPLTADYSAADLFLSAVDVDAVPVPGTMIASAIELALQSFPTDVPSQKAIVVVSDGENTEGDVLGAVQRAKEMGVRVYTVGMGTLEGAPIPVYDGYGNRVDYKRDRAGSIVLTRLDESMLQQIAAATGGSYHRAASGGDEIDAIFNELASLEKAEFGTMQVTGYEDQYQYPLALALILLLVELLIGERKMRLSLSLQRFSPKRVLTAGIALLLVPFALNAQTVRSHVAEGNDAYKKEDYSNAEVAYRKALEKDPASFEARFNLGNTAYKQQRYDEAARSFANAAASASEASRQAMSMHNLGNTLLKSGKINESIEAYKHALRLNPNDEETRYNLEYARRLAKQHQNQQQNRQQERDQQQQKRDKEQQASNDQQQANQQNQQQQQAQSRPEQAKQDQLKQQQAQQKNQMPIAEAERILEALKNNERQIQKQLRKREGAPVRVEKDW